VVPRDGGMDLTLTDGSGFLATTLVPAPGRGTEADLRARLPKVDDVCAAARACLAAMPPPPPWKPAPGEEPSEIDFAAEPDPAALARQVTDARTLRECLDAWTLAADALEVAGGRAAIPRACATVRPDEPGAWWRSAPEPPFTPF